MGTYKVLDLSGSEGSKIKSNGTDQTINLPENKTEIIITIPIKK